MSYRCVRLKLIELFGEEDTGTFILKVASMIFALYEVLCLAINLIGLNINKNEINILTQLNAIIFHTFQKIRAKPQPSY